MSLNDRELHLEKILELEFGYARETAGQAQSDRTAMVNLYLILVGGISSVLAGLAAVNSGNQLEVPREAFALLFFLMGVIGFFIMFKLIRLRQAWAESVREMNQIKDYYVQRFPDLAEAFLWRKETIPPAGKLWSITFNLVLLVTLIDSTAVGAAVHMLSGPAALIWLDALAGVAALVLQIGFYFFQLGLPEAHSPVNASEAPGRAP